MKGLVAFSAWSVATALLAVASGPLDNPEDQWRCCSTEGVSHAAEFAAAGFNTLKDNTVANLWSIPQGKEVRHAEQLKARVREHAATARANGLGLMPYFRYCYSLPSVRRFARVNLGVPLYADSDKIDILVHARSYGTADYVFAVNDRRTDGDYVGPWRMLLEKGQPNAGVVTVKRTAGAVYDLVKHRAVPFESKGGVTRIPVSYDTNDGRVFMVVDAPLKPLSFTVEGSKLTVTSSDRAAMIPIRIDGFGAKPWYAVVRDGFWSRDFGVMGRDVIVTNLADGREA